MRRGLFITVEGTDGAGKTTQIGRMKEYLTAKGYDVILTREPGGTGISEKIREIILDPTNTCMSSVAEMLLYASARAQLVSEVIRPAVESGKNVICDRFVDSSYVYQGFGRGIDLDAIVHVNQIAIDGLTPDITFFLNLDPETALERRKASTGADRIEQEEMDFHRRVYEGYRRLAERYPDRIKTIECDRSIEDIAADIRKWLDRLLER